MRSDRVVSEVLGEEHTLTPSDLYNAELKTNLFGGYSKNQVDALLERAADVLEMFVNRNRELKQQVEEHRADLDRFHDMEESLRSALVSSQKMSENIIASARFQADALLEEAQLAKAKAMFQMEQLPEALRAEIGRLAECRNRMRDDIAALLKSHGALLERIPRAEDTGEDYIKETVRSHFVALPDDAAVQDAEDDSAETDDTAAEVDERDDKEKDGYVDI